MRSNTKGIAAALVSAVAFGTGFVAQKAGDELGAFTFTALRFLIGAIILLPICIVLQKSRNKRMEYEASREINSKEMKINTIIGGMICGIALFAAISFQQFGIRYTSAAKAGFLTSLYTVLVPILGVIFFKRVIEKRMWLCVGICVLGFYFLCVKSGEAGIGRGALLLLVGAFFSGLHVNFVGKYAEKAEGISLTCVMAFTAGTIAFVSALIFEPLDLELISSVRIPILYVSIVTVAIAATMQAVAQRYAEPTQASLIMSLESVVAVVAGAIILSEHLQLREYLGCAIIFTAIILSQVPINFNKR